MGVDLPDFSIEHNGTVVQTHNDDFKSAVKMSFIGVGQGGGRLAQSFSDLGYSRVCAVNTTEQDLASLDIPDESKLVIGSNKGGAGKDPEQGRLAALESREDIVDLLHRSWGVDTEHCWVCVGAGGGSGTGSWPVVLTCVEEYSKTVKPDGTVKRQIGVIITMPKRSEGSRVQRNAHEALVAAVDLVDRGDISSLIIIDNSKIHDLYPGLPVKKFWTVANQNFASVFHVFNLLASENSEYNTFDRADYRSVLNSGIMIFGSTRVNSYSSKEDVAKAIRGNLVGTLLADGFDLSSASTAAAIVVAHDDVLQEVPMENIDYAFFSLGRIIGKEDITLHSGIYEGTQPGMMVFTIISGLEPPQGRLDEIKGLSA